MPESAKEGARPLAEGSDIGLGAGCRRFESCHSDHVVADYVSFATTFFMKSHRLTHAVAPPFRKKSRSAHLLGYKRPRDGSLSLPTFLRDARVQILLEKMLRGSIL